MNKIVIAALGLLCASSLLVNAQDAKPKHAKRELTAEQKTLQKDILAKYDANKDGKLDKKERAKISKEDKEKMKKAGLLGKQKADKAEDEKKSEETNK